MKRLRVWIISFALAATIVQGGPAINSLDEHSNEVEDNSSDGYISSLTRCSHKDGVTVLINCAASRALKVLQQACNAESVELVPGVALISESPIPQREGKSLADEELPKDPKQRTDKLLNMILNSANRFFSGRTLKIKIPELSKINVAKAIEEGRGKMKKAMSPLILALGAKALLLKALVILGLGLMSVKALVIAKIALVIAVVAGAQSLFGGAGFNLKNIGSPFHGGHGWTSGWSGGSGYGPSYGYGNSYNPGFTTNTLGGWGNTQYPYARSIDNIKDDPAESTIDAQHLAYSKQKP